MNRGRSGTIWERDLVQKEAEVEYAVTSLGVLLRCARYGPIERLGYPRVVSGCGGGGALLYIHLDTIKTRYALGISRLIRDMAFDMVLTLAAIEQLGEIE